MHISRRDLLKLGNGIASAVILTADKNASAAKQNDARQTKNRKEKIIIIGAGISGLAAGKTISNAEKCDVIILEARDRIGGRIWTDHKSCGVSIDLGASWIHGTEKNPLYDFATENKIRLVSTDSKAKPDTFDAKGRKISPAERDHFDELFQGIRDSAYDMQEELSSTKDISLGQALEKIIKKQKLSTQDLAAVNHLISTEIENDYATSVENLSLVEWDKVNWFKGKDHVFPEGYDQLLNILAKGLDIRLNMPVTQVSYDHTGVKVSTTDGTTFEGTRAIITLPLGVLQSNSVTFSPELPKSKQKAIRDLAMGNFDKLYLKFPERFWSETPTWIEYIGEQSKQWPMFLNLWPVYHEPILAALNVGDFATSLEEKTDKELVAEAMTVLSTLYGKIPDPIAYKSTRWKQDPYARGSYSHIPPGKSAKLLDQIGEPVIDRLFFAGEATNSIDYASAHAAYMSGLRVANYLLCLGNDKPSPCFESPK